MVRQGTASPSARRAGRSSSAPRWSSRTERTRRGRGRTGRTGSDRYRRRPVTPPVPSSRIDRALWVLTVVWAGLVVTLSLTPDDPSAPIAWDKARHAGAYTLLAALALLAAVGRPGRVRDRPLAAGALVVGTVVALGALVEVLQQHAVSRDGSFGDALADSLGALVALGLWWLAHLVAGRRGSALAARLPAEVE
jgi:VanZ family protein